MCAVRLSGCLVPTLHVLVVEYADLHEHLQKMIETLQRSEYIIEQRVAAVEDRIKARVEHMTSVSTSASRSWIIPFALLVRTFRRVSVRSCAWSWILIAVQVLGLLGGSLWAYRKYRQLQKTHLL